MTTTMDKATQARRNGVLGSFRMDVAGLRRWAECGVGALFSFANPPQVVLGHQGRVRSERQIVVDKFVNLICLNFHIYSFINIYLIDHAGGKPATGTPFAISMTYLGELKKKCFALHPIVLSRLICSKGKSGFSDGNDGLSPSELTVPVFQHRAKASSCGISEALRGMSHDVQQYLVPKIWPLLHATSEKKLSPTFIHPLRDTLFNCPPLALLTMGVS